MRIQCPNCRAVYDVEAAHIPQGGRHGRCKVCQERFLIKPAPEAAPSKSRPAEPKPRPKPSPDWRVSRYTLLYRVLQKYYLGRDNDFRYHISAFCFAHREIPSLDYIKDQVRALQETMARNQQQAAGPGPASPRFSLQTPESENMRCRTMIQIFRDLVDIRNRLARRNVLVTYNQVFNVLKDVDLALGGKQRVLQPGKK